MCFLSSKGIQSCISIYLALTLSSGALYPRRVRRFSIWTQHCLSSCCSSLHRPLFPTTECIFHAQRGTHIDYSFSIRRSSRSRTCNAAHDGFLFIASTISSIDRLANGVYRYCSCRQADQRIGRLLRLVLLRPCARHEQQGCGERREIDGGNGIAKPTGLVVRRIVVVQYTTTFVLHWQWMGFPHLNSLCGLTRTFR